MAKEPGQIAWRAYAEQYSPASAPEWHELPTPSQRSWAAVEAAIRASALEEAATWQPIETAPDDGTKILIVGGAWPQATIVQADGGWWRFRKSHNDAGGVPTHWMPLPPPPRPADGGEAG